MPQFHIYLLLAPFAAAVSTATAFLTWRSRRVMGFSTLTLYLVLVTGYLFCSMLELLNPTEAGTFLWARLGYIFSPFIPVAWLIFAMQYTNAERWLTLRRLAPFVLVPLITTILAFTSPLHHLLWLRFTFFRTEGLLAMRVFTYGGWFWVQTIYSTTLLVIGVFLIWINTFRSARLIRRQSRWVLAGALLPLPFALIFPTRLIPSMMLDYTAIAFAFAGVCFAIGVLRYRLLEVAPIARSLLVDQMHDPVLVVDSGGRISDYNPAARALFAQQAAPISGTPVSVFLPNWQQIAPLSPAKESETIFSLPENPLVRQFQMRIITISNRYGAMLGWLIILHDITEQQRLMTELEELARRDSLTGLYNRRYWVELAHAEIERSHRYGTPLAIILLDLDGFKAINDSHGHLVGDDVLKQAATAIQTSVRRVDVPARWGGDEFIILLPETSLADAELAAERLSSQLQNTDVVAQEIHFTITASLGIAGWEGKPLQLDELLECADSALYESKGKGRNRVTAVNCQGKQPDN